MIAGGLFPPKAAHASAALLWALLAHEAAAGFGLRLRVGVHAGPLTSGLSASIWGNWDWDWDWKTLLCFALFSHTPNPPPPSPDQSAPCGRGSAYSVRTHLPSFPNPCQLY